MRLQIKTLSRYALCGVAGALALAAFQAFVWLQSNGSAMAYCARNIETIKAVEKSDVIGTVKKTSEEFVTQVVVEAKAKK